MLRKPLVNEIVRSFTYSVTHPGTWPFPIFGARALPTGSIALRTSVVLPFILYASRLELNYFSFNRAISHMAEWLRSFTTEEQDYAVYLIEKYYVNRDRTPETCSIEDQSHFC